MQAAHLEEGSELLFKLLLDIFTSYDAYIVLQMGSDKENLKLLCKRWEYSCNFEHLVYFSDVMEWVKLPFCI